MLLRPRFLGLGVELEGEIDRRIDEAGDGGEGDDELGRSLAEAQTNHEDGFAHLQMPKAVLDDDGHIVGEALGEMLGNVDADGAGLEGDRSEKHTWNYSQ